MSEKPELVASYPDVQPWHGREPRVAWVNRSEAHLKEAGLMAVGFPNGAVFLAPSGKNIQAGDAVKITEIRFRRPEDERSRVGYSVFFVSRQD